MTYKEDIDYYDIAREGKKQFQIDVELTVDESDYKIEVSTDY